jgi:YD repeat-containing protein
LFSRDIEFNPRSFSVAPLAGPNQDAGPVPDAPVLAGRALEEQRIGTVSGEADQVAEARLYSYETRELEPPATGRPNGIRWAAASAALESVATAPGQWRQRQTTTTYDDARRPVAVTESGWLDVAGDERCTATTYASNPDQHILGMPASSALHAGDCGAGQPLTYAETMYDGLPLGQVGEHGRVTKVRTQIDPDTFAETTTEYDSNGKVVRTTDAEGRSTTTARTADPPHGIPYLVAVENELGQRTATRVHPGHGGPMWVEDANGNRTHYRYDAAGRLVQVWLADQDPDSDWPAYVFGYDVRPAYRSIHSARLGRVNPDGTPVYEPVWNVYDGFWRLHETQYPSPEDGYTVIRRTSYDTAGHVEADSLPTAVEGEPGRMIVGWSAGNRTHHRFDDLGRQVSADWYRGQDVAHSTVTEYGADTVAVTGPDGSKVRTTTDGLGREVEVAEWDGEDWVAATYGYDLAGNLTTATDPAGNTVTNSYNLAGWLVARDDPDRGQAEYTYNLVGQQTSATDALGKQVFSVLDQLGRTVETRLGAPDGELVGAWEYDTAPGGIGALATETSYTPMGEWVSEVDGYDELGRPHRPDPHRPRRSPRRRGHVPDTRGGLRRAGPRRRVHRPRGRWNAAGDGHRLLRQPRAAYRQCRRPAVRAGSRLRRHRPHDRLVPWRDRSGWLHFGRAPVQL